MDIIKYKNRKLYDKTTSKFVTLDEIRGRLSMGEHLEAKTLQGEDITQDLFGKCLNKEFEQFGLKGAARFLGLIYSTQKHLNSQ